MKTKLLEVLGLMVLSLAAQDLCAEPTGPRVDIQFFGDTFISWHGLKETQSTIQNPVIFSKLMPLMERSTVNVINFEGVATGSRFLLDVTKRFHLLMPLYVGKILGNANIDVATLANNHAMDYGYAGLFDTLATLNDAGIATGGAGKNIEEAIKPIIVSIKEGNICILAYSRTLPYGTYARMRRAGTANLSFTATLESIRNCAKNNTFTFVVYHWGEELTSVPKDYQTKLAKLSIDNGADVVLGHHPHILQPLEFYKGKPIIYSLGNFVFGTRTHSKQEGVAVGFKFANKKIDYMDLVPINVQNSKVNYIPRLFKPGETTPAAPHIPKESSCKLLSEDFGKENGSEESGLSQFYRCQV